VPKKRKTDRQITNCLNVDAILNCLRVLSSEPAAHQACHMSANHSDCRCTICVDRGPVTSSRYTT